MAGVRYAYTLEEDKKILSYIIEGHFEAVVRGNALWIKMEEDELCPGRSWQSLKNRFKRNIFPDISRPEYGLTSEERALLKAQVSSNTPDVVKRNTDPRLIKERLEKHNSDSVDQETNKSVIADSTTSDYRVDRRGSRSSSKTVTARRDPLLSPPDKTFFSLDMEWSDSD